MSNSVRPYCNPSAPLSMGFSRQEYWSHCHFLFQGIFLTQGLNPCLLLLLPWQVGSFPLLPPGNPQDTHAAAAAKSLQSCPTLCNPIDGSPPGSPVLGFFRQEHWSGLPFPSPMRESESEVTKSCPTLCNPMDCSPPCSSVHGIFQARALEWGAIALENTNSYKGEL